MRYQWCRYKARRALSFTSNCLFYILRILLLAQSNAYLLHMNNLTCIPCKLCTNVFTMNSIESKNTSALYRFLFEFSAGLWCTRATSKSFRSHLCFLCFFQGEGRKANVFFFFLNKHTSEYFFFEEVC